MVVTHEKRGQQKFNTNDHMKTCVHTFKCGPFIPPRTDSMAFAYREFLTFNSSKMGSYTLPVNLSRFFSSHWTALYVSRSFSLNFSRRCFRTFCKSASLSSAIWSDIARHSSHKRTLSTLLTAAFLHPQLDLSFSFAFLDRVESRPLQINHQQPHDFDD